jgi:hypothetical protein
MKINLIQNTDFLRIQTLFIKLLIKINYFPAEKNQTQE